VNEGYTRVGVPGTAARVQVAHYCVPPSDFGPANGPGYPGPGAVEAPVTVVTVP